MINQFIINKARNKSVIFVDFFDTVMFREVHSNQLIYQWEKSIKNKYPSLLNTDLIFLRKEAINKFGENECAISYKELINEIYNFIDDKQIDLDDFYNISYLVDYSVDMATQYINKNIINTLKYLKSKYNKKIYLVSDYYLPGDCYDKYLKPYELDDLFDGIYCSSDLNKTKYKGNIYKYVLGDLNIKANNVLMIGDSKHSDYDKAKENGIEAYRYFPILHKLKTNIRKRSNYDYSKHIAHKVFKNTFKNTLFGDYSLNLYYFTKELSKEVHKEKIPQVGFLARGGTFYKNVLIDMNY